MHQKGSSPQQNCKKTVWNPNVLGGRSPETECQRGPHNWQIEPVLPGSLGESVGEVGRWIIWSEGSLACISEYNGSRSISRSLLPSWRFPLRVPRFRKDEGDVTDWSTPTEVFPRYELNSTVKRLFSECENRLIDGHLWLGFQAQECTKAWNWETERMHLNYLHWKLHLWFAPRRHTDSAFDISSGVEDPPVSSYQIELDLIATTDLQL